MDAEGGLVRIDALRLAGLVMGPKVPKHQLELIPLWKAGQPIDTAVQANPVAHLDVVVLTAQFETKGDGLPGGKKPLLTLGDLIEGV